MKKKAHVLQVTGTMNRGGAEVMLMDLYRNISTDTRFDFLINVKDSQNIEKGDFDEEIHQLGGRIEYIGTQWSLGPIKYISHFKKIIQKVGLPDVVHIHLNAKCGIIAMAASLCGVKKIIAHSHADLKFRGSFLHVLGCTLELKFQKLLIALFATDFWGCSPQANQSLFYGRYTDIGKTVVIKNAVNVAAYHSVEEEKTKILKTSFGVTKDTLILGNVGRVVRHKRVDFIIDVLNELKERGIDFLFVYAGRFDDKEYQNVIIQKIREYQLESNVLHLGDRGDIPEIMSTFDVFVAPALKEGFGLVAAEAQAAGVPCVLYTGFPPNVDMGLNLVTFIDVFDVEKWADLILESQNRRCEDKYFIQQKIAKLGYDISENTKHIEQMYCS